MQFLPSGKGIDPLEVLDEFQVMDIISQGRSAPEHVITAMLDRVETEYPSVYRFIYGEPSDAIAVANQDMAELFIDLSCDVIWVFINAFGDPPVINNEEEWVLNQLSLINSELNSIADEISMDERFRKNLQDRFVMRSVKSKVQIELLAYLNSEVTKYASFKQERIIAMQITNNMLFVLVKLMGDLYCSETQVN